MTACNVELGFGSQTILGLWLDTLVYPRETMCSQQHVNPTHRAGTHVDPANNQGLHHHHIMEMNDPHNNKHEHATNAEMETLVDLPPRAATIPCGAGRWALSALAHQLIEHQPSGGALTGKH